MFTKGDIVEIRTRIARCLKFNGLRCEVIESDGAGEVLLKPLSDRPDGHDRTEFWWSEKEMVRVESVQVGNDASTVETELIDAFRRFIEHHARRQIDSTVEEFKNYMVGYLKVVDNVTKH